MCFESSVGGILSLRMDSASSRNLSISWAATSTFAPTDDEMVDGSEIGVIVAFVPDESSRRGHLEADVTSFSCPRFFPLEALSISIGLLSI